MTSTYIVSREPLKFFGGQEYWNRRSHEVVQKAAGEIGEALSLGSDLSQLFFRLLTGFSLQRGEIAREPYRILGIEPHPQDCYFGKRRDRVGKKFAYLTPLEKEYDAYNQKVLGSFRDKLKKMGAATKKVSQDTFEGVETSLELEVLQIPELMERGWLQHIDTRELPAGFPVHLIDKKDQMTDEENWVLKAACQDLKNRDPKAYTHILMSSCFETIQKEYPSPGKEMGDHPYLKSRFVLGTAKVKCGDEWRTTTRYLTWLYVTKRPGDNMFDRMVKCSKMMLIHTDNFEISERLKDCSRIFARAIQADDVEGLRKQLKRFTFTFAHTMPDERGSAAMNEWFLLAIAQAKGLRLQFSPDQLGDLEALTQPLYSEFSKSFDSGFRLSVESSSSSTSAAAAAAAAGAAAVNVTKP
jgi:Avirulence protein